MGPCGSRASRGCCSSALLPGGGRRRRHAEGCWGGDPPRPAAATLAVSGAVACGRRRPLPAWELPRFPSPGKRFAPCPAGNAAGSGGGKRGNYPPAVGRVAFFVPRGCGDAVLVLASAGGVCEGECAHQGAWRCWTRRGSAMIRMKVFLVSFLAQGCAGNGNGSVDRSCTSFSCSVRRLGCSKVRLMLICIRNAVTNLR